MLVPSNTREDMVTRDRSLNTRAGDEPRRRKYFDPDDGKPPATCFCGGSHGPNPEDCFIFYMG